MASPKKSGAGYPGQLGLNGGTSQFGAMSFLIEQMQGIFRTCTIVKVVKCTNAGGVSPMGTVDVIPIINMVDGLMQGTEHGTVYGLSYARVQGGRNAVICDPRPGDLGVAVISDRDTSVVKKTKKVGNPGSRRRGDLADGIYLFTILAEQAPQQYVRFVLDDDGNPTGMELVDVNGNKIEMTSTGIKLTDKTGHFIDMNTSKIAITGDVEITGKLSSSDMTGLAGGAKKVVLDGDPVSGGVVHATSTKTTAT
jgi:hypothetical protein